MEMACSVSLSIQYAHWRPVTALSMNPIKIIIDGDVSMRERNGLGMDA